MAVQSTLNYGGYSSTKIPYSSYIPNVILKNKKLSIAGLVIALASTTWIKKKYNNNVNNNDTAKEKVSSRPGNGDIVPANTVGELEQTDKPIKKNNKIVNTGKKLKKRTAAVDRRFFEQIRRLVPILVPGIRSKEFGLVISLALVLVLRTYLDIWFSGFNGAVVKSIVSRNKKVFKRKAIYEFAIMMWPLSIVNNALKLTKSSLALAFRQRLSQYAHDTYLKNLNFYRANNVDNRLHNIDQCVTQDIDKFAICLSNLYCGIAKPLVDVCLFSYKLQQAIGRGAPMIMIFYFISVTMFLKKISPPFGKLISTEQRLEGDLRYGHSRLIAHSEEIGAYRGINREKIILDNSLKKIVNHIHKSNILRFFNGIFDSIFVKYCATMLAFKLLARPLMDPKYATMFMGNAKASTSQLIEDYSRNSGYLVNLSQAIGRLILAGRDLSRFAGYTSRISDFIDVLNDVDQGIYSRYVKSKTEGARVHIIDTNRLGCTVIRNNDLIRFTNVPVVTPAGDVLIEALSFEVRPGINLLITGPNGCGKSSIFRIINGLWPVFGGTLELPDPENILYLPQKPYMIIGSLRDQLIYPHTRSEALKRQYTDDKLERLLATVGLQHLLVREGGWDVVADWSEILSGGEKQRLAMARLYYHQPKFAILDECTSAVSTDIENHLFYTAKKYDITIISISHRASLLKHHTHLLRFDEQGNYEIESIDEISWRSSESDELVAEREFPSSA